MCIVCGAFGHVLDVTQNCRWSTKDQVMRIVNFLRERKFTIWLDDRYVKGDLYGALSDGIRQSRVFMVCLSKNYEVQ